MEGLPFAASSRLPTADDSSHDDRGRKHLVSTESLQTSSLPRRYVVGEGLSARAQSARCRLTDRDVVIKVAEEESEEHAAELLREFRLLADLHHPQFPRAIDHGKLGDGRTYLVTERAPGERPRGPLSREDLAVVIAGIGEALSLLHSRDLVHRDLKPDHVRLHRPTGRVMLLDLGLALPPGPAADVRGTLGYLAPEALERELVDHRADLYSLGVTLQELATGSGPDPTAPSTDGSEALSRARPDLPPAFAGAVASLLAPTPSRRPADIREACSRLLSTLWDGDVPAPAPEVITAAFSGRRRALSSLLRAVELAEDRLAAVAVVGEDGSGRSRLLDTFRAELVERSVSCLVLDGRDALLRAIIDGLPLLVDADLPSVEPVTPASAARVIRAAAEAIREDRRRRLPLVIAIDDFHEVEASVRGDVEELTRELSDCPVALVTAHEPTELSWPPPGSPTVRLDPLRDEDVASLMASALRGPPPTGITRAAAEHGPRQPRALLDLIRVNVAQGVLVPTGGEWRVMGNVAPVAASDPASEQLPAIDDSATRLAAALVAVGDAVLPEILADIAEVEEAPASHALRRLVSLELAELSGDRVLPSARLTGVGAGALPEALVRTMHDRVIDALSLESTARDEHRARGSDPSLALTAAVDVAARALDDGDAARAERLAHLGLSRVPDLPSDGDAASRNASEARLHHVLASVHERRDWSAEVVSRRRLQLRAARNSGDETLLAESRLALGHALLLAGEHDEAAEVLAEALASAEAAGASHRAAVLVELAELDRRRGDLDGAAARLADARSVSVDDVAVAARVRATEGRLASQRGDYGTAEECFRSAVSDWKRAGHASEAASVLGELGWVQHLAGNGDAAGPTLRTALNTAEKIGDLRALAGILNVKGAVASDTGRTAETIAHYRQALQAYRRVGDVRGQLAAANNLGWELYVSGDVPGSVDAYREVLRVRKGSGQRDGGMTLNNLGVALCSSAEYADAMESCEQALALAEVDGDRRLESEACWGLGKVYAALGGPDDAMRWQRRALAVASEIGNPLDRSYALAELGPIHLRAGDLPAANAALEDALDAARAAGCRGQQALALVRLGRCRALAGDLGAALRTITDGLAEARAGADRLAELEALRELGALEAELCDHPVALQLLEEALAGALESGSFQDLPRLHESLASLFLRRALRLRTPTGVVVERSDLERARHHVEKGLDLTAATGRLSDRGALLAVSAASRLAGGDPRLALDEAEQAVGLAGEVGDRLSALGAELVRADALAVGREFGAAFQAAREALGGYERAGVMDGRWKAHATLARIHAAWGMGTRELAESRAAEEVLESLSRSLSDPERARRFALDVERRSVRALPTASTGPRARRTDAAAISTERFAGKVDPEDLVESLVQGRERLDDLQRNLGAVRNQRRTLLAHQRLVQRATSLLQRRAVTRRDLGRLLAGLLRELSAERAFIVVEHDGHLRVLASAGVDGHSVDLADYSLSLGVVRAVLASGRPSLSRDALHDRRFGELASVRALELRSLACVPLSWDGTLRGVLYVDDALKSGTFRQRDLRTLTSVGNVLAAILETRFVEANTVGP